MTATIVDVESIEHLDFDAVIRCNTLSCHDEPASARPATRLLVATMPCCVLRSPICEPCSTVFTQAAANHMPMYCSRHIQLQCAHLTISFEPLP